MNYSPIYNLINCFELHHISNIYEILHQCVHTWREMQPYFGKVVEYRETTISTNKTSYVISKNSITNCHCAIENNSPSVLRSTAPYIGIVQFEKPHYPKRNQFNPNISNHRTSSKCLKEIFSSTVAHKANICICDSIIAVFYFTF